MLCWQWSVDQSQVPNNLLFMQLSSLKPFGSEDIDAPHNLCCSSSVHVNFLDMYSSATTSMIPELPSEPFVERCHVRVLRASPCVSLSSFVNCVKTSMSPRVRIILLNLLPLRKQRAPQSTTSQAETERDANTKVELDRRNETMSDVYRAPSPLGVPSFACQCRFLCSCFLRRSPWPAFADPSLFGALQLRLTTPELIPSKWDPKQASSTSLSMLDVRTLTKNDEAQGKTSTRRETRPSLAEDNSKTSNTTSWCSWYRWTRFFIAQSMSMMSCQADHGTRCCCHGKFIRTGMRIFVWKTVEGAGPPPP